MRHHSPRTVLLIIAALLAVALLGAPAPARGQPVYVPDTWGGDFWSRPRVTGSWGGLRDEFGKKGVVFDVDLLPTPQAVLSGGSDTGVEFWGNADYTLNVDTGKLGLWPGGFLKVYAGSNFGESLFSDTGTLVPANTAWLLSEPNEPSTTLMHATFMLQRLGDLGLNATLDLQIIKSALKKNLNSSGQLENTDTAVVGGLRLYARF